jgi:site-specific recombinase XerD
MKLDRAIADYIQLKRALGFRFCAQSHTLRSFGRSMGRVSLRQVRPRKVQAFLAGTGAVTRSWPQRWSTLNGFYRFAITRGLVKHSPLPLHPPKVINTFRPHIYTVEELRRLLGVITSSRTRSLSPVTMRTLLLLLYGAGLRISEALNLEDGDVDLSASVLQVRRSKFFKTRLVPIGPRLTKILAGYQRKRSAVRGSYPEHYPHLRCDFSLMTGNFCLVQTRVLYSLRGCILISILVTHRTYGFISLCATERGVTASSPM